MSFTEDYNPYDDDEELGGIMHDDGFDDFFKSNFTSFSATVPLTKDELHAIWKTAQMLERRETQSRWVKCSERLPTKKEGEYFCVIQGRILDEVHTDFCIGGLSDSGDLLPTEPVAPQWKIIAWLENVPEYAP